MINNNNCPYCQGLNFSAGFDRRPDQSVERCNNCLKYCVRSKINNVRYTMSDPFDSGSLPQVNKI